jgi:hypothetical protein
MKLFTMKLFKTSVRLSGLLAMLGATMLALVGFQDSPAAHSDSVRHHGSIVVRGKELYNYKAQTRSYHGHTVITTDCFDLQGKHIAREQVKFHTRSFRLVESVAEDFRNGRYEAITLGNEGFAVKTRADNGEQLKDWSCGFRTSIIPNTMILPFIQNHLPDIVRGEDVWVELLIAARQQTVGFYTRLAGETTINGVACYSVNVVPSSWILRQFVSPLQFVVEKAAPHRLMQYKGKLATITDTEGREIDALVVAEHR